jgi:hypothetical protein
MVWQCSSCKNAWLHTFFGDLRLYALTCTYLAIFRQTHMSFKVTWKYLVLLAIFLIKNKPFKLTKHLCNCIYHICQWRHTLMAIFEARSNCSLDNYFSYLLYCAWTQTSHIFPFPWPNWTSFVTLEVRSGKLQIFFEC